MRFSLLSAHAAPSVELSSGANRLVCEFSFAGIDPIHQVSSLLPRVEASIATEVATMPWLTVATTAEAAGGGTSCRVRLEITVPDGHPAEMDPDCRQFFEHLQAEQQRFLRERRISENFHATAHELLNKIPSAGLTPDLLQYALYCATSLQIPRLFGDDEFSGSLTGAVHDLKKYVQRAQARAEIGAWTFTENCRRPSQRRTGRLGHGYEIFATREL